MSSRQTVIDTIPCTRHIYGRRRRGRFAVQHEVECDGVMGTIQMRVLDLSRSGALVTLRQSEYRAATDSDLFAVAARLTEEFPEGMSLRFVRQRVAAQASLVRVARQLMGGPTVVGCKFARALTFEECRSLEIKFHTLDEGTPEV